MLTVSIDESEVRGMVKQKIMELLQEFDAELVFWDTAELKRRTCLSWNTIQDQFFYHPDFPKFKVGSKWMFPARETREFLTKWLSEQPQR